MGDFFDEEELARFRGAIAALPKGALKLDLPLHVLLDEAAELARFVAARWEPSRDPSGALVPGLAQAAGRRGGGLYGDIGEELLALTRAAQEAHRRYLLTLGAPGESPVARGRFVLGELAAALAYLFDDGVVDDDDAVLARLARDRRRAPRSRVALAIDLGTYREFARRHADELAAIGVDLALLDEAEALVEALYAWKGRPRKESDAAKKALALRDGLLRLLQEKMKLVRAAARFVFRNEPAIAREATSGYRRKKRAAQRARKRQASEVA